MLEYNENGQLATTKGDKVVAILSNNSEENRVYCKVLCKNGHLFKKNGLNNKRDGYSLRLVNEECFNTYLKYLQTNIESIYTQADRMV